MAFLAAAAPYIMAAGTVMQSASSLQAARQQDEITKYNIRQAEKKAIATEADAQQQAKEIKRQYDLKKSRVIALAAASGGSSVDPDILNILAGFEGQGNLEARTALYEGTESAKSLMAGARGIAYEGASKSQALRNQAASTILSGASSIGTKYAEFMR